MRVCLIKPPMSGILGLEMITFAEPLGLACLAGSLEKSGHRCCIIDLRIDGMSQGLTRIKAFEPHLIGIQSTFTTERFRSVSLAIDIKKIVPEAFVAIGGHDASRQPEWFLKPGVDAVVIGDGENTFAALADALENGNDLSAIPGLMLSSSMGPNSAPEVSPGGNLDDLPIPARHLMRDYADKYYLHFCKPLALLETARGCPYRCSFCSVWKFHNGVYREKSVERVLEELAPINSPYVFITDDIFWFNAKRSEELGRAVRDAGIRKHFFLQSRTDIIVKHPDLVKLWSECGKITVFLGLEKLDDAELESINKRNSAQMNDKAIEIIKRLGIGYTPNFIVDPLWDHQDFSDLRKWVVKNGAFNAGFSVLTPLPGTDLWEEVKDRVNTSDWELFDLEHAVTPTKLPLNTFYREYSTLWKTALDTRYKLRGRAKTYLGIAAAVALGKINYSSIKRGMLVGHTLSKPATFLKAHRQA